jgi:hypothetical protein
VLPGPLTIPPILIGLWVWSTEPRSTVDLGRPCRRVTRS